MNIRSKIASFLEGRNWMALADQAVLSGGNFLVGMWLAVWLGLNDFGVYALWWMVVLFCLSMHQAFITKPMLSLFPTMEKETQRKYWKRLTAFQSLFCLLCIGGIFVFGMANEFWNWIPQESNWPMMLGLLAAGHLFQDYIRKYFYSLGKTKAALIQDVCLIAIQIVALFALWLLEWKSLTMVFSVLVFAQWAVVILGFFQGRIGFSFSGFKALSFKHWSFSKWLLGAALFQWFSGNYFIIIGGTILGPVAAGALRIAQQIMGLTHLLFLTLENTVPQGAAKVFSDKGMDEMLAFLKKTTLQYGKLFIAAIAFLLLALPIYFPLIFKNAPTEAYWVIPVFSAMYILVYLAHPYRFFFRTMQATHPIFFAYFIAGILGLFLAEPVISNFGWIGLLAGIFGMQAVQMIVFHFFYQKIKTTYKHKILKTTIQPQT